MSKTLRSLTLTLLVLALAAPLAVQAPGADGPLDPAVRGERGPAQDPDGAPGSRGRIARGPALDPDGCPLRIARGPDLDPNGTPGSAAASLRFVL